METPRRHLLVDGHNVLHVWGWMTSAEPVARARLIEVLRIVHDVAAVDVTTVFDSRGSVSTEDVAAATPGFVVTYASAGLTADGVIERLAGGSGAPGGYIVATGDAAIRGNVSAAGGESLSPDDLRAWIERCRARARRALDTRTAAHQDAFGNKLPL